MRVTWLAHQILINFITNQLHVPDAS